MPYSPSLEATAPVLDPGLDFLPSPYPYVPLASSSSSWDAFNLPAWPLHQLPGPEDIDVSLTAQPDGPNDMWSWLFHSSETPVLSEMNMNHSGFEDYLVDSLHDGPGLQLDTMISPTQPLAILTFASVRPYCPKV